MTQNRPQWLKDHPGDLIFKLYENHNCVGQVWYRPTDMGYEIDFFEVEMNFRGQGLGIKLMNQFLDFILKKANITSLHKRIDPDDSLRTSVEVWLEVSEQNVPAIKTYERSGFKAVGRRPKYYPDGSDAILMSWIG